MRDQPESAFATILQSLVSRVPGTLGAALVDSEGETVDYAGRVDPFGMRVAAAHARLVLDLAATRIRLGRVDFVAMRTTKRSYLTHRLPENYALVLLFARAAGGRSWRRAVPLCVLALVEEAGWPKDRDAPALSWFPVDVVPDSRRRPAGVRMATQVRPLEILGSVASTDRGERCWRVRFETGAEIMIVRESGGSWYADEPLLEQLGQPTEERSRTKKAR